MRFPLVQSSPLLHNHQGICLRKSVAIDADVLSHWGCSHELHSEPHPRSHIQMSPHTNCVESMKTLIQRDQVFLVMEKIQLVFCEEFVEDLRVEKVFLHVLIHDEKALFCSSWTVAENNESRVRLQDSAQLCGRHTDSHPSIMFYQSLELMPSFLE